MEVNIPTTDFNLLPHKLCVCKKCEHKIILYSQIPCNSCKTTITFDIKKINNFTKVKK